MRAVVDGSVDAAYRQFFEGLVRLVDHLLVGLVAVCIKVRVALLPVIDAVGGQLLEVVNAHATH